MNKTVVIYHSADFDGVFSGQIAKTFLPDAELIGWDFRDQPLVFPEDAQTIYIIDLPVDRVFGWQFQPMDGGGVALHGPEMGMLKEIFDKVIWIDHHKSSIDIHPMAIPGYRIDGVAACRLAWHWFSSGRHVPNQECYPLADKQQYIDRAVSEPLAVRLAGENDIWDKRDPNADIFQFGLRSIELGPQHWLELLMPPPKSGHVGTGEILVSVLLENGQLLQRYQQRSDAGMMGRSFLVEHDGLVFLALNTARCNSLTFASKDVPETGHDALLGFYYDGKMFHVSLYHARHRTDLDLSTIAVKYGGGGHRGACGFKVEKFDWTVR